MKRAIRFLLVLSLALTFLPAPWTVQSRTMQGQQEHRVYMPLVTRSDNVSDWKIIVPQATQNYPHNPSFEYNITDDWTFWQAGVGGVAAHSTTRARFGHASAQITAGNLVAMMWSGVTSLADGETYYASGWVYATAVNHAYLEIYDTTTPVGRASVGNTAINEWELLQTSWTNTTGGPVNIRIQIRNDADDSVSDVWWDAIQGEIDTTSWTTYCDGDQRGCEWLGTPHNSDSRRSAQSRAGGVEYDLQTDYHLNVSAFIGTGMPPLTLAVDSYAILPGGQLNSIKTHSRVFTLVGFIQGDDLNQVHDYRQELLDVLKKDAVPPDEYGYQPVLIRYTGADVEKEIAVHYEAGLGANINARQPCWEMPVAIRFLAPDPFWYEIGESAILLDTVDVGTCRIVAARLRVLGQWSDLGPIHAAGNYNQVNAIAIGPDGIVYFGGDFTNWDNIAAADYIVSYDPQTGTWAALAAGLNQEVRVMAFAPDGTLYVGGWFTNAGGDANADYLCQWNGVAFSSVNATPLNNFVEALEYGPNGVLYIGGLFTNAGGDANADYVCQMSTTGVFSSLNATPLGGGSVVYALETIFAGTLYVGGNFVNAGGDADADYVCQYDYINGGAFSSLNATPLNNIVHALKYSEDTGILYIGGDFLNAGGDADADYFCQYHGLAFSTLGGPLNNPVYNIQIGPDGIVYFSGNFTQAGDLATTTKIARWNGSSYAHIDLDLPGAGDVYGLALGSPDPVINRNYDVWVGATVLPAPQDGFYAGLVTANNEGTAVAWPRFVIHRFAAGSAFYLETLRNETMGRELLFNYLLQPDEILTVDLTPTNKNIVSNFYGQRFDAVLANSDLGTFVLQPGDNDISCFANDREVGWLEAYLVWREAYWSHD